MPLPLIGPAVATAGRWAASKIGQLGLAQVGRTAATQTATKVAAGEATKKGFLGTLKGLIIPETKLGKAAMGGFTLYGLFGGSDAQASEQSTNDNSFSLMKTALTAAGIGGLSSFVTGGSFFKNALQFGTIGLGAGWVWKDLNSDPSIIKGIAKEVLPEDTYRGIFGDSNNLKNLANPNAQDTQVVKDTAQKEEEIKQEQVKTAAKQLNDKMSAEFDETKQITNSQMFLAVAGEKEFNDEQKKQYLKEITKNMDEQEKKEFFKQMETTRKSLDNALKEHQSENKNTDSAKIGDTAETKESEKKGTKENILDGFGDNFSKCSLEMENTTKNTNDSVISANANDSTATQNLGNAAIPSKETQNQGNQSIDGQNQNQGNVNNVGTSVAPSNENGETKKFVNTQH